MNEKSVRDWSLRDSRSNLSLTADWIKDHPAGAALFVALMIFGGIASLAGMLRWQAEFARWSFAALCWLAGAGAAWIATSRRARNAR